MQTYYPEKNENIDQLLASRYGITSEDDLLVDTDVSLVKRIKEESVKLNKKIINNIPPKFNQDTLDFLPIPQYQFPTWPELERNFKLYGIYNNGVLFAGSSVWQYVYPFQHMLRRHKLFLAHHDKTNIPLCAEIIRQAETSCLYTPEETAILINKELAERNIKDFLRLVIITRGVEPTVGTEAEYRFGSASVLWDVQVFPGHTIAYQTFGNTGNPDRFHLSDRYLWRMTSNGTYITGLHDSVLPLINYRLPVVLEPAKINTKVPAFNFHYV